MIATSTHPPLYPDSRCSPYYPRTVAEGVVDFLAYNHMYMPMDYGRDPREDYDALLERVTLWDVGAERQTELRGPDALRLADYLSPRNLRGMKVGACRYTPVCDEAGEIMVECIVLQPWQDVVWFSHGDADLTLWARGIAHAGTYDVTVSEPDVAPLQLQGPRAPDVLAPLVAANLAALGRYRCTVTRVAGVDAVVSNTGWSRGVGFEIYPLGSERALDLWDALVEAGRPHGLLVTGPNGVRVVEQGISDTAYATNSHMNPIEAGMGHLLDLDGEPFVGRDALLRVRANGPARRTIGLLADGDPFPWMEQHWPITVEGREVGVARWAVWSFALERNIAIALVDVRIGDDAPFVIRAPDGDRRARIHPIPFVP